MTSRPAGGLRVDCLGSTIAGKPPAELRRRASGSSALSLATALCGGSALAIALLVWRSSAWPLVFALVLCVVVDQFLAFQGRREGWRYSGSRLLLLSLAVILLRPLINYRDPADFVGFGLDAGPSVPYASRLALAGVVSLAGGLLVGCVRRHRRSGAPTRRLIAHRVPLLAGTHVFLSAGLFGFLLTRSGNALGLLAGRTEELRELNARFSTYFVSAPASLLGTGVFLLAIRRPGTTRRWGMICVGLGSLPYLLIGSRSLIIVPLIAVFLLRVPERIRTRTVVLAACVAYVFASVFAASRETRTRSESLSLATITSQLADPPSTLMSYLSTDDSSQFRYFAVLVDHVDDGTLDKRYGATYTSILARPIPRILWAGKPVSFDQEVNNLLVPEARARGFSGFSFSMFGEPYYNFGVVGLLLVPFALGLFGTVVDRRRVWAIAQGDVVGIAVFALIAAHAPIIARGSISADWFRIAIVLIPVLVLGGLLTPRLDVRRLK